MATIEDWINHFRELTGSTRLEIRKALETLDNDPMFHTHYGGDLSNLKYAVESADRRENLKVKG